MRKLPLVAVTASIVFSALGQSAQAQDYPSKVLRVVTAGAGGGSDFIARIVAQGISNQLGQNAVVDNRPTGFIPGMTVAKAPPDGYTLLVMGSALWLAPLLQQTPYDPVRDFSPVTLVSMSPNMLVVHPSVPASSVSELIALAKSKPATLNFVAAATGGSQHLSAELFKAMTRVDIVRVPYKSGSQEMADLVGGHVQLSFAIPAIVMPHVKANRLRALAVTSAKPWALAPDLPTIASTVPGYESATTTGVLAPAHTPAGIIKRLNQEIVRYIGSAETRQRLLAAGVEPFASSTEAFATIIKNDVTKFDKVVKDAGIRME